MSNAQDQLKPELKFCQNLTKFQNRPKSTQQYFIISQHLYTQFQKLASNHQFEF
jgi:hypothetical protein